MITRSKAGMAETSEILEVINHWYDGYGLDLKPELKPCRYGRGPTFEVGDVVECLDEEYSLALTVGRLYTVLDCLEDYEGRFVSVLNDRLNVSNYHSWRFSLTNMRRAENSRKLNSRKFRLIELEDEGESWS